MGPLKDLSHQAPGLEMLTLILPLRRKPSLLNPIYSFVTILPCAV